MNEIMNIQGIPCYEENGVAYLNPKNETAEKFQAIIADEVIPA